MTNNSKHKTHISKTRKNKNFYIVKQNNGNIYTVFN